MWYEGYMERPRALKDTNIAEGIQAPVSHPLGFNNRYYMLDLVYRHEF